MTAQSWLKAAFLAAIPGAAVVSVVDWLERNFRVVGSAKTERFDRATAPWLNDVLECARIPGRYTLIKPVQSGGTTAGEGILCFWIATWNTGDIAYFWPNDAKADDRWQKYTEKRLQACEAVRARAPGDRHKWVKGNVFFPHLNFSQLGVHTDRNVASDSIRGVVNEELHVAESGWEPGRLDQVYGRQQAVWNRIAFNISNASLEGTELHHEFVAGTQEPWVVRCPGCRGFHFMRTRWQDEMKHLGGLRYDSEGCRREDGSYDYFKLASTIRFQMPCGYVVHDTPRERRELSAGGKYGDPQNSGAPRNVRSWFFESVTVHDTDWMELIRKKHTALRALKYGDPEPWSVYLREQECHFWNPADRPSVRPLILSSERKKDRAGLSNRKFRFGAFDRQEGRREAGEVPHWWGLIMDFDAEGNSLVVFEGMLISDGAVVEVLRRHEVQPWCVVCDSGSDTEHVYDFCLLNGYTAIKMEGEKGGGIKTYLHADNTRHYWSEEEDLWAVAGRAGPVYGDNREPAFFLASKQGAFNLLSYMRASAERKFEIPGDVSKEFKSHFQAWSFEQRKIPITNTMEMIWKKAHEKAPDHLFCCASYIALLADQAELIGANLAEKEAAK